MWVVGGEQQTIPANPLHDIENVLADVLGRPLLEVGHFATQAFEELVQAPRERRQPTETTLDQDHLETWEAFEHSFDDQAGDRRLARGGVACALLDVIGRPARSRVRMAARAEYVEADGEVVPLRRGIDWPVALVAERFARACQHERLRVDGVVGTAFDLCDGGLRVLRGYHDCCLEAWFRFGEILLLPVIGRRREGRGKFLVKLAMTAEAERA